MTSPVNPRDPRHDGVTTDLALHNYVFAHAANDGATYCCGATLEAFWRTWTAWCAESGRDPLPSASAADALVTAWFCPTMGHGGAATAIAEFGLGHSVPLSEARAGDICQFWRSVDLERPSGHSVLFLGWGDHRGSRTVRYWSSQPATSGIGEHEEVMGPEWTFAFGRVGRSLTT